MKQETKISLSANDESRVDKLIKQIIFKPKYKRVEKSK
tara:strand:- start:243 stop:356 length:114 start_codon:yes stop_codon:yes gene_type:complete